MSKLNDYIKNEKRNIQEDFDKGFMYLLAFLRLLKEAVMLVDSAAKLSNNPVIIKNTHLLTRALTNMMLAVENFELKVPMYDTTIKFQIRKAFEERIEIFAITLSRIPVEQHADIMSMLQDFCQGNFTQIDDSLLEALIQRDEPDSIEGIGLIHEINPSLNVEQKEYFAKRITQWADYRNLRLTVK